MDQCVKLGKFIREDRFNQFSTHLGHCHHMLTALQLGQLLFQIFSCQLATPNNFIEAVLGYEVDINLISQHKNRFQAFLNKTPLMVACQFFNFQTATILLTHNKCQIDICNDHGDNALFHALLNDKEQNSYQIISAIVGLDQTLVNSTNKSGSSILLAALQKKSLRIIQLLLKNSADPNFKCKSSGNTPLHEALLNSEIKPDKKKDLILLLLNHNADPLIRNMEDKTAFDIAKQIGFELDWLNELYNENEECIQEMKMCIKQIKSVTITKEDDNTIDQNISLSVLSDDNEDIFKIESFSQEILLFSKECEKTYQESWKDIAQIYQNLHQIGSELELSIDINGSYATGLWTQSSDIDIVFTNVGHFNIDIEETLKKINHYLLNRYKDLGIKELYLNIKNIGNIFPNIKIEMDSNHNSRKIDITIFQKKNNGQKYVKFILSKLYEHQFIKPVFFSLRELLRSFNLHNPAKNGLKTYTIFIMILFLAENMKFSSVGELFINTIYYYAECFTYEANYMPNDMIEYRLNLSDPLNSFNNIGGKKTDVNRLREMFKTANYGLKIASGRNILDYLFSLNNIFN